jgi:outer membrane protein OmpA-like peptidoglycan-associated protein
MRTLVLLLTVFLLSFTTQAQSDLHGSEDHPLISRYPGSAISGYHTEKYFEYDFATGPVTGYRFIAERETHAGQLYRIFYTIDATAEQVSVGEVYQDYLRAFRDAGVEVINHHLRPAANEFGGDQWLVTALKPQPPGMAEANALLAGTSTAGDKFALMGKTTGTSGTTYIAIYGERHSDKVLNYLVDILESQEAELDRVSLDADYLGSQLREKGAVSIYGIEFDHDSAVLRVESDSIIRLIATFIMSKPEMELLIVGHTDMNGTFAHNQELSGRRAQAVVDRLVAAHGVPEERLSGAGVGYLAPKATNSTEAGRQLNRRVELVLRQ